MGSRVELSTTFGAAHTSTPSKVGKLGKSTQSKKRLSIKSDESDDVISVAQEHFGNAKRRGAVSAEQCTEEDAKAWKKVIVHKEPATVRRLQTTLGNNLLFRNLDDSELRDVFDAMFPVDKKPRDVIITQGADGDNFYVVDSGTVSVSVDGQCVTEIGPGGSFGELALIYNQPRAATVKAKTAVKLWAIDRRTYRRLIMGATIRKRQMYTEFLAKVPILSSLDEWERATIADALESVSYKRGENVVEQGQAGDQFYIVLEGEAEVRQNPDGGGSEEIVGKLQPSDFFGEIALLLNRPRAATVTAKSAVLRCAKLDRARFERVLGPCMDILKRDIKNYNSYVKLTESIGDVQGEKEK